MNRFALLVVGLALVPAQAHSQPIAVPDVGCAGVGIFLHWADRDYERPNGTPFHGLWSHSGLFVHETVAHRVVLMIAGSYQPPYRDSRYPDRLYTALGAGGGATVYPLITGPYRIGASFRWYRQAWLDQSIEHHDKVVDGISVSVQAERGFKMRSLNARIWIAPAYMKDRLLDHPGPWPAVELTTTNNFGALGGVSLVLFGHVAPYVQLGAVEHLQTQAGVSYIY